MIAESLQNIEQPSEATVPKAKILLVDDRTENLLALQSVLEPLDAELVSATSGLEALRHILRQEFAVILLDAQMPEFSGFATAELIRTRERNRHTPIIFITAYGDSATEFQGYSVGAVDYMAKPFHPDILKSKVRVFVELYKRGEEIKRQQELIRESELREADRIRREQVWSLEQEHMRQLNLELEERVAQRTSELVIANEELEAFCYSVSHDLRAPLRAIMSTSMILLEENDGKLEKEHVDLLLRQANNADRLGKLIDDLLQLSRIGRRTIERKLVDITAICAEISDEILGETEASLWQIEIEPGLHAVGDPSLIRLILQNLIDNAFKYSPNGGAIQVGVLPGDEQVFYVKDSGIGFDMKYAPKIFLPFERLVLESDFPGTGIGLATVHRIIRKHGGRVWVESALGKGSTFFFTLAPHSI